jgi:hypothetical protein
MMLLAVALDQVLMTHLRNLSNYYATVEERNMNDNPAEELIGESFWQRIQKTPEISNILPMRLDKESSCAEYLRDLVDRRNRLMHVEERPIELFIDLEEKPLPGNWDLRFDPERDTSAVVSPDGKIQINIHPAVLESNLWDQVSPAEVRRTLEAVKMYNQNVIVEPKACEFLIPIER